MYHANVKISGKPYYATEYILEKRMYVEAETVKELYYACYSLARMLANLTQKTTTFRPYETDEFLMCFYVTPRIYIQPRKIAYYNLPDI